MLLKNICNSIRKAVYGIEVRESIARGLEMVDEHSEKIHTNQTNLEEKFNQLIINAGDSNSEIVIARIDETNGKTYETIGDRLDDMSENINKTRRRIPRKIKSRFGIAEWWITGQTVNTYQVKSNSVIKSDLEMFKKIGVESVSICVHACYGKDISINATSSNWYIVEKKESILYAFEQCKEIGLKVDGLKFMTYGVTKSFVVQNIETFKEFWKSEINSFCEYLSDNSVELELVTVFNEIANIYNNSEYDSFVMETLSIPKQYNYMASITTVYPGEIFSMSTSVLNEIDALCSNMYPQGGYFGKSTTLEQEIQVWDRFYLQMKSLKDKFPDKPIYITETGCQDRWEALCNPGDYKFSTTDGTTKSYGDAPALFLKGLFESKMCEIADSIIYWYYDALYDSNTKTVYEPITMLLKEYLGGEYNNE